MTVRVDDRGERTRTKRAHVGAKLIGQWMGGPRVDDDEPVLAADDADRLVQPRVASDPDPVADLAPD